MSLGGTVRGPRARGALAALPVALACAALWPAGADAFVGCNHSGGTLRVFMNQDEDAVTIVRGGDAINVVAESIFGDGPAILLNCSGGTATVDNTDEIVVDEAAVATFTGLLVDLNGGSLAPGATPEADGTSEIEVRANLFGPFSLVAVNGTPTTDFLDFGRTTSGSTGLNANTGAETAPDVDVELTQAELVSVAGGAAADVIRGRSSPGFAGPVGSRTAILVTGGKGRDDLIAGGPSLLDGGRGNDRLLGSRFADELIGAGGRDLIKSGRGNDRVFAALEGRDRVNCGAGRKDRVSRDSKDRVGGCELVRKPFTGGGVPFKAPDRTSALRRALSPQGFGRRESSAALDLLSRK